MRCKNCNFLISNKLSNFCENCGVPLKSDAVISLKNNNTNIDNKDNISALAIENFNKNDKIKPWSSLKMTGMVLGSLMIPVIGIILGIYGIMKGEGKKNQGKLILIVGALSALLNTFLIEYLGPLL